MNLLRRIYLLLLGLLLVIAVTLLLLSPQAVGTWVGSISELSPVIRIGLTILIDLFLFALMYLQVRPDPGSKVSGLVMRGSGAITEVSVESARDRILKAVSEVRDVVSAEASVKPVRGRADIEMQVAVFGHDVKLPEKQKEINRALKQVIDKQLGLQMAGQPRIHIRIHVEEPPKAVLPPVPAAPDVMKEPLPADSIVTLPKVDPEPELKPSLEKSPQRLEDEAAIERAKLPDTEPETELSSTPTSGLFDAWRRERGADNNQDDKVTPVLESDLTPDIEVLSSPSLSSVLSEEPTAMPKDDDLAQTVGTEDDLDAEKLDLDDPILRSTVVDDVEDDEIEEADDEVVDEPSVQRNADDHP